MRVFTIDSEDEGQRLDQFLCARDMALSRNRIQRAISAGEITVNGALAKKAGVKLKAGDTLHCNILDHALDPNDQLIPDFSAPLHVIFEDEDLLVLNKPRDLCVHAGAGNLHGTLVERVMGQGISLSSIGLPIRPGVVHRLDKGTSGVMVLAKTDRAHLALTQAFAERRIKKTYLALVIGRPTTIEFTVTSALGRHPTHRQKFASVTSNLVGHGKSAITHFRVRSSKGPFTLIEARPETGRTHQIRVHLSESGYPIVGDAPYGGGPKRLARFSVEGIDLPLLHAYRLAFAHPISSVPLSFKAPLPELYRPFIDIGERVSYDVSS